MSSVSGSIGLKEALKMCTFDRLCRLYQDKETILKLLFGKATLVSDAQIETDRNAARKKMEAQLGSIPVDRCNNEYRRQVSRHMESVGGMKVTIVEAKGSKSFVYTCGFTKVGGKELLIQNVHRSTLRSVYEVFSSQYKRHNQGHPLGHGHTLSSGDGSVFFVVAPDIVEASLLKATKMLETNRIYGLTGYDVLVVVAVGKSEGEPKLATREEALALAAGLKVSGFQPHMELGKPLQECAWCHKAKRDDGARHLLKCSACKNAWYCSSECQRLDWKKHKAYYRLSKKERSEAQIEKHIQPFVGTPHYEDLKQMFKGKVKLQKKDD